MVGNDLSEFSLDKLRASWLITKTLENMGSFIKLSLDDEVTWGLRKPEKTTREDNGPEKLKSHWDTV